MALGKWSDAVGGELGVSFDKSNHLSDEDEQTAGKSNVLKLPMTLTPLHYRTKLIIDTSDTY